ncbi:hypothetical protein [Caldimonas tepidiphila]|uniref:hypothetical protein n=1 Tax=Caldimonas tepidiphila TaxID=2315841 RepID=UPI000E5A3748|nr:hypothetical protein [Caldimonas tepidiphila]
MSGWRLLGGAAMVTASALGGWMLNERLSGEAGAPAVSGGPPAGMAAQPSPESSPGLSVLAFPRPPLQAPAAGTTEAAAAAPGPVTLFADGTVTIDVHRRPWRSVLEEVARQENARTQGAAPAPRGERPGAAGEARQQEVLQAIRSGDESSRYQALLQARSGNAPVPDDALRQLFEIDASERVRLLAFENYLERRSGSAEDVRSALESALNVPSAAIQAEARKRLQLLDEQQRAEADDPQARAAGS